MQAEQRAKIDKQQLEPRSKMWQAFTVHGSDGKTRKPRRAFKSDKYVVVEDIDDGRVVFEVSEWPRIDYGGRLVFSGDPYEIYQDLGEAQKVIDEARSGAGVTGADRLLRIGDVFAVRGLHPRAKSLANADLIRDVSLAARNAAKAALFGAAASTVEPEYVEQMALDGEPEKAVRRRGEFDVRQDASRIELKGVGDSSEQSRSL